MSLLPFQLEKREYFMARINLCENSTRGRRSSAPEHFTEKKFKKNGGASNLPAIPSNCEIPFFFRFSFRMPGVVLMEPNGRVRIARVKDTELFPNFPSLQSRVTHTSVVPSPVNMRSGFSTVVEVHCDGAQLTLLIRNKNNDKIEQGSHVHRLWALLSSVAKKKEEKKGKDGTEHTEVQRTTSRTRKALIHAI